MENVNETNEIQSIVHKISNLGKSKETSKFKKELFLIICSALLSDDITFNPLPWIYRLAKIEWTKKHISLYISSSQKSGLEQLEGMTTSVCNKTTTREIVSSIHNYIDGFSRYNGQQTTSETWYPRCTLHFASWKGGTTVKKKISGYRFLNFF